MCINYLKFELQQEKLKFELFLKCIPFVISRFSNIPFVLHHGDKTFRKQCKSSSESAVKTRSSHIRDANAYSIRQDSLFARFK